MRGMKVFDTDDKNYFFSICFSGCRISGKQSILSVVLYGCETDSILPCAGNINGAVWEQNSE